MIVAADEDWGIGLKGNIPWKIPGEQSFFRWETTGGYLLMGRKTYSEIAEKFPDRTETLLPERKILVVSKTLPCGTIRGAEVFNSIQQALTHAHSKEKDVTARVYACGGISVYHDSISDCSEVIVSRIPGSFGCDSVLNIRETLEQEFDVTESIQMNGFRVVRYQRNKSGKRRTI